MMRIVYILLALMVFMSPSFEKLSAYSGMSQQTKNQGSNTNVVEVKKEIRAWCEYYSEKIPSRLTLILLQSSLDGYCNFAVRERMVYWVDSVAFIKNNEIWVKTIIIPVKGGEKIEFTLRLVTKC